MIFVTGDTHGMLDDLMEKRKPQNGHSLTDKDKMIVCGDFGFVYKYNRINGRYPDDDNLDKLEAGYPCELLFVSGNQENFDRLYEFPDEERYGGIVKRIRNNIFLLKRGEVYEIEGKKFFTFGGAYSVDKFLREDGYTWWKQELPSPEEYRHASDSIKKNNNEFDCIITHTCPQRIIHMMGKKPDAHDAELTGFLDWIFTEVKFRKWFFGHWHIDESFCDGKAVACYENVYSIE